MREVSDCLLIVDDVAMIKDVQMNGKFLWHARVVKKSHRCSVQTTNTEHFQSRSAVRELSVLSAGNFDSPRKLNGKMLVYIIFIAHMVAMCSR